MLITLLGCWVSDLEIEKRYTPPIHDADGDGYGRATEDPYYSSGEDCDDENPEVHPNAEEVCDEVDNNCNGEIDEGLTSTFYLDQDGDGYGNSDAVLQACTKPAQYSSKGMDCDDSFSTDKGYSDENGAPLADGFYTHPSAAENEESSDACMEDSDGDGYGAPFPNGCCYTLQLRDIFEDGWKGAFLDLYHNAQLTTRFTHIEGPLSTTHLCVPVGTLTFTFSSTPQSQGIEYVLRENGHELSRSEPLSNCKCGW